LEIVRQERKPLLSFQVDIAYASQTFRVASCGNGIDQADGLIAANATRLVDWSRHDMSKTRVFARTRDKESRALMQPKKPREIDVAAIDQIDRSRLEEQFVEDLDFVCFAVRHSNDRGNMSDDIEQRMQFDRALALSEFRPRKKRKAQIDGRCV